jgi:hypothetical protein
MQPIGSLNAPQQSQQTQSPAANAAPPPPTAAPPLTGAPGIKGPPPKIAQQSAGTPPNTPDIPKQPSNPHNPIQPSSSVIPDIDIVPQTLGPDTEIELGDRRTQRLLQLTPIGKATLDAQNQLNIKPIAVEHGKGSSTEIHQDESSIIRIDKTMSPEDAALTLVHETAHILQAKEDKTDVFSLSKKCYVSWYLKDESKAAVREFEFKEQHLRQTGERLGEKPLDADLRKIRLNEQKLLKGAASSEKIERAIHDKRVERYFSKVGDIRISGSSGLTYRQHAVEEWQALHPKIR